MVAGLVWSLGNDGLLKAVDPQSGSIKFTKQFNTPPSRFTSLWRRMGCSLFRTREESRRSVCGRSWRAAGRFTQGPCHGGRGSVIIGR